MKFLVVLSVLLLVGVSSALPTSKHRWELTENSDGQLHLVDLNPYEAEAEPLFVPEQDMFFVLYTRSNPIVGQRINVGDLASVQNSNYNPAHPTRVMIHGWGSTYDDFFNTGVTEEYMIRGDYNVIAVDWSVGSQSINYIASRNRVGAVGARTAQLVDFLHLHGYLQFATTHFIGISLGGHAVGHAGKALTRGRVQVIYSLDPAGPLFNENDPDNRVDSGDAVYVETIITNGGTLGILAALGHANFFPNFGRSQPGCGTDITGVCAHVRAIWLYIEAINSVFTGHECASFQEILNETCTRTGRTARFGGLVPNIGMTGNFFFETNEDSPYTRG